METKLPPLAISGVVPTSMIFAQWLCDEDTIDLVEVMKYHEDCHKSTIDLLRYWGLLNSMPKGMEEEVWNDNFIDNHRANI